MDQVLGYMGQLGCEPLRGPPGLPLLLSSNQEPTDDALCAVECRKLFHAGVSLGDVEWRFALGVTGAAVLRIVGV